MPTCVFLSEKSTLLRVRGAMPWARIFFVYGRAAGASGGPAADGPRAVCVRNRGQSDTGRSDTQRCAGKGRKMFFGERLEGCLLCPPGGSRDRVAAIAALGIGTTVKTARTQLWYVGGARVEAQLVAACGRRSSLSSLYTLDAYV